MGELGVMYGTGQGVPQDDVLAHMWFNLAASRSTGEARESAISNRDIVAGFMTPDQVAEAQRLARGFDRSPNSSKRSTANSGEKRWLTAIAGCAPERSKPYSQPPPVASTA